MPLSKKIVINLIYSDGRAFPVEVEYDLISDRPVVIYKGTNFMFDSSDHSLHTNFKEIHPVVIA